ncbi:hypothetical protein EVAR_93875_1 [Eumeta japonica]|uniref:Uncharacterized protein n=1 Tax=Eumeta variegata TaxID=151549 RepID=A0A4C1TWV7_EUMVA|nr:hypothetical protein EVAR_93875_1 [Eumeta japonica]
MAVFLRAAFRSVGLRMCTSMGAAHKPRAVRLAVCTPIPHTVSAPRVVLAIFATSRGNTFTRTLLLRLGNPEGFLTFALLAPLCLLAA